MNNIPKLPELVEIHDPRGWPRSTDSWIKCPNDDYFTFKVDGEYFPWYISERGPKVYRYGRDLYAIEVEILELEGFRIDTALGIGWPVVKDTPFPWPVTADGCRIQWARGQLATMELAFYAKKVEAEGIEIHDMRALLGDRELWSLSGDLYQAGRELVL